jgi:hypothetical protein
VTDTSTSLRFSLGILRRLGEELSPSLDQSILELVKNSFDASARECTAHGFYREFRPYCVMR